MNEKNKILYLGFLSTSEIADWWDAIQWISAENSAARILQDLHNFHGINATSKIKNMQEAYAAKEMMFKHDADQSRTEEELKQLYHDRIFLARSF